jgi:hypothetical protein
MHFGIASHQDHDTIAVMFSFNLLSSGCWELFPLLFYWGETERANMHLDMFVEDCKATYRELKDSTTLSMSLTLQTVGYYLLDRGDDCYAYLKEFLGSFQTIADKFKEMVDGFAGIGEFGTEGTWLFTEQFIFHLQMMWLLSCPKDSIDVEQVFAGLKGPEVATEYMLTRTNANGEPVTWNHTYFNTIDSCLFAALAHERFGYDEQALAFAVMTCEEDLSKGGNEIAWTRSLAKSCRGRYYTKRGQYDEAQTQFQEAADLARFYKYGFIEALVLRDWHQYLEEHGYASGISQRLASVMLPLGADKVAFAKLVASVAAF